MTLDKSILSRLSLIKYYFEIGYEQSLQNPPSCYFSILTFHDAVELFLVLGGEFLNATVNGKMFILDYWNVINQEIKRNNNKLSLKASFKKFNQLRKNFKHYGIIPNKEDIEYFRIIIRNFFEENTPIIFGIQFEDITLVDLVQIDKVKNVLIEVQNLREKENYRNSLSKLGYAYRILIKDFKNKYRNIFNDDVDFDIPNEIKNELNYIYSRLEIALLGIDYRRYITFDLYTTHCNQIDLSSFFDGIEKKTYKKEDVDFCMKFVIDCAIRIQNFINAYKQGLKF